MGMFRRVRDQTRAVAEQAAHVSIDHERLAMCAASLQPAQPSAVPPDDPARRYLNDDATTASLVVTLDTINFGSGYFPHLRKRPGMSGYFTVATALEEHYRAHGPIPPERLVQLTQRDCIELFGQEDPDGVAGELMRLFAEALNDLGNYLTDRFGGNVISLIEAAGGSVERLAGLLVEMPFFNDVQPYRAMHVPFYKRAQIVAADLSLAFGGRGLGHFDDLDSLTIFADNLVPHVLRMDGVLVYDSDLAGRIDCEQLISMGSPEEVEIRACAVHATELMLDWLHGHGNDLNAMQLDAILWNRGQAPSYKQGKPRHRTRTVYY